MKTTFKSLIELLDYYKDEATCQKFLELQRWDGKPQCPHCGAYKPYRTNRGFKCTNKACQKKFSIRVGTIYENSKIPLRTWYAAIYLVTTNSKGISSYQIAEQLSISQHSAWFLLHRIRETLKTEAPQVLKGTVEIDETYYGGKSINWHKSKRRALKETKKGGYIGGRSDIKETILGMAQRKGGIVLNHIPDNKVKTIMPIINTHVKKGSYVYTDEYPIYRTLNWRFKHNVVRHKLDEFVRDEVHTNTVEGSFGLLKNGLRGTQHSVSKKHLQRYLDEFSYRYSERSTTNEAKFNKAVLQSNGKRLKYVDLIAKPDRH